MRIALAANLASGGGTDPQPLVAALERDGAEAAVFTCEAEDLERLEASGPDRIAVAGGDGTIGPVAAIAGRLGVPLAVIPAGTANDFARANGLPADRGVMVQVPDPNSPAAKGGLRDGDIIIAADGQDVRSSPDLLGAIRKHQPGEQLRLRVARMQGATVDVTVTLGEQSSAAG